MSETAGLALIRSDFPHIPQLEVGLMLRPKFIPKSATSLVSKVLFTKLMLTIKVPIATLTQPITVYISDQNSQIPM